MSEIVFNLATTHAKLIFQGDKFQQKWGAGRWVKVTGGTGSTYGAGHVNKLEKKIVFALNFRIESEHVISYKNYPIQNNIYRWFIIDNIKDHCSDLLENVPESWSIIVFPRRFSIHLL